MQIAYDISDRCSLQYLVLVKYQDCQSSAGSSDQIERGPALILGGGNFNQSLVSCVRQKCNPLKHSIWFPIICPLQSYNVGI